MAFREVKPEDADLPAEPASMVAEPPAEPAGTGEYVLMLYKKRCIAAVRKRGGNQVLQAAPLPQRGKMTAHTLLVWCSTAANSQNATHKDGRLLSTARP